MSEQHNSFTLTADGLDTMIQANIPDPSQPDLDLVAADGTHLFSQGRATPGFEDIMTSLAWKQGMLMVNRIPAGGGGQRGYVWFSPQGMVYTSGALDAQFCTVQAEEGGALYRTLIDMLDLSARPAPRPGFEPVRIRESCLSEIIGDESAPDVVHRARTEVAHAVRPIAEGPARCVEDGDFALLMVASNVNSVQGDASGRAFAIDTPAGLLLHTEKSRFMRSVHRLEPTAAWLVLTQIVSVLPTPEDIAWWAESLDR